MRRLLAAAAAAATLAACQDYQFTPVNRCLLQPGRASISTVGAIDLLFVVDDSLSMDRIQAAIATNFGSFIDRLAQKQQARVAAGKEPFDVYVAVTSTSVLVNRYDGLIFTSYYNYTPDATCTRGVLGANGDPYPAGSFVAAAGNPRVLALTRNLNWASASTDPTIQDLILKFRQNIQVGTCGANQEMPFQAARLAIEKALDGRQGVAWPHPNSQLAVVFVGNEDDCSTRRADQGGLVWDNNASGPDSCQVDAQLSSPQKLYPDADFVSFLTGLRRPLVAAFVRPGFQDCAGAGGPGTRMHRLATELSGAGASVIEASVCGAFASALESIADQLTPPDGLALPTTPAAGDVTQLRVQGVDGEVVHLCQGPDARKEWWFVDCGSTPPAALDQGRTSACIQILKGSPCQPTAGQTLQAEYLGRVPAEGCTTAVSFGSTECAALLGGEAKDWGCVGASAAQKGTCVCAAGL